MRDRRIWPLLALLPVLAITACGSTVQVRSQLQGGVGTGPLGSGPAQGVPGATGGPTSPNESREVSSGPVPGIGQGPTAGGPQTPGLGTSGPQGAEPVNVPKATGPLEIGIFVTKNADTFYKSAGLEGVSLGDTEAAAQAVVDEVNATGGIAGRKVKPVYAVLDASSTTPADQQEQAACSTWTEDAKVFAAVSPLLHPIGSLNACLAQRGVSFLVGNEVLYDEVDLARYPTFYTPGMVNASRVAAIYAERLNALQYFTPGTRLGIIRDDTAAVQRAVQSYLRPGLKAVGVTPEFEEVVPYPATSDQVAQVQNIVLKFKRAGIDHVMFLETGAGAALYFMPAAEAQAYRPRYALTSYDGPTVIAGTVPAAQLAGSVGVGWFPLTDVQEGPRQLTPAGKRCGTLMAKRGLDMSNGLTALVAFTYCDTLFLLQQSLRGATDLTPAALRSRIEALGSTFPSAITFATDFRRGRRDGAALERDLRYVQACSCFQYVGPTRALP